MAPIHITADRLFDGTNSPLRHRPLVRIDGQRILAIEEARGDEPTAFHFPGCTILPGLIDTHVHLVFSAADSNEAVIEQVTRETDAELFQRALANAQAALRVGLTTLRDCGGKGAVVQRLRDAIGRGEVVGPDILSCGMPITTRRGHCHWLGLVADTAAEVREAANQMLGENADFLKVMATGGNMTPSSDPLRAQFDPETLTLIADIGRQAGKQTAAHVLSRSALPGAVQARVRTIEHCDWRVEEWRYEFDPDLARRMIDQGQYVGLTMSGTTRRAFLPQLAQNTSGPIRRLDMRFECERRMLDFGVRYTLHSDAGVRWTPIDSFALGLRTAVIELRLTPAEVLVACTSAAAEALALHDRGILAPGKRADVLIVEGDPLRDLANLEGIRAVMKGGDWLRR